MKLSGNIHSLVYLGALTLALNLLVFALGFPLDTLDARFSYPPKEIGALLWRLGEEGRARYLLVTRLDSAFILVYATFLVLLARHLGRGWLRWLAILLAVLTALFDGAETGGIRYLLQLFPEADDPLARLTATCTTLKWLAFLATGGAFGLLALRKFRVAGRDLNK